MLRVGCWNVDLVTGELSRGDTVVKLPPRTMSVLKCLAAHPGEVVSNELLMAEVWEGVVAGDDSIYQHVARLRKAFGDNPHRHEYIETIPRRGYRLTAVVRNAPSTRTGVGPSPLRRWRFAIVALIAAVGAAAGWLLTSRPEQLVEPDRPSVLVLPLENLSGDPNQDYFSEGFSQTLATVLAKEPAIFVAGRSHFAPRQAGELLALIEAMNVEYVVRGSVQRGPDQLRINVQLVNLKNDESLWAEQFDRPLGNVFAVQDEITRHVLLALLVNLTPEREVFRRFPTQNFGAYDLYLQAFKLVQMRPPDGLARARVLLGAAVELDPAYAAAYALAAFAHWYEWLGQFRPEHSHLQRGFELAERALALDPDLSLSHQAVAGFSIATGDYTRAIRECRRAVELDEDFADVLGGCGRMISWAGDPHGGLPLMEKATRLDPLNPSNYSFLGDTYRLLGRFEEAVATLNTAIRLSPNYLSPRLHLAVAFVELGRIQDAQTQIDEAFRINPGLRLEHILRVNPYALPEERERYLNGLGATHRFEETLGPPKS